MSNHPEELYTQDEVTSLPVTQNSPTTSLAKLSTCSNERNEGDDQRKSELNKQELSSPPKSVGGGAFHGAAGVKAGAAAVQGVPGDEDRGQARMLVPQDAHGEEQTLRRRPSHH